jgi:hypothetical protein
MMMPAAITIVVVIVAAVSAAFGLEGRPQSYKISSETKKHILDHMVGPHAENLASNLSRQMSISEMPSEAHKLIGIFMPDLDNQFSSGLHP